MHCAPISEPDIISAFPDRGRGYCVLHDLAITIRRLQAEKRVQRVMVVDLDFHQGDGTQVSFSRMSPTFSLFRAFSRRVAGREAGQRPRYSHPAGRGTSLFGKNARLRGLAKAMRMFSPDLVLYVAGSDPYEKDVLPGTAFMKLTLEQLHREDDFIIDTFADLGVPLASVFAGGYGPDVWEVHYWATQRLLERSGTLVGSQSTCQEPAVRCRSAPTENFRSTVSKMGRWQKQLLKTFTPQFPQKSERYFEPFVGGGAVFFALAERQGINFHATISDCNEELINCYSTVRDRVEELIEALKNTATTSITSTACVLRRFTYDRS